MQVWRIELLVASQRSRDDTWRPEIRQLQVERSRSTDISSSKSQILIVELRAKEKRKARANTRPKNNCERGDCIRWTTKANVDEEIRAHSSMSQTRKAKERDDLVHLLQQVHRTKIRKVMEMVVMTEVEEAKLQARRLSEGRFM